MDAQTTQETALREAFAPFANGRTVYLPVDREARKYRPIGGDEFMLMYSDADGHWLKHRETRNYLLVRRDGTIAVIVGKPGEDFLGGFYGEAPIALAEVA
jgi:hypothetical protein